MGTKEGKKSKRLVNLSKKWSTLNCWFELQRGHPVESAPSFTGAYPEFRLFLGAATLDHFYILEDVHSSSTILNFSMSYHSW